MDLSQSEPEVTEASNLPLKRTSDQLITQNSQQLL